MGCDVVVLSGSDRKKDEAMKLGAKQFIATKDAKELKVERPLDRLLVTTSAQPEWEKLVPIMASNAIIHPISLAEGNFSIPYSKHVMLSCIIGSSRLTTLAVPLILNGWTVQGSVVASRHVHKKMLEFAALHKIAPIVERFPMTAKGIEEAMGKLENGSMRYRGVLIPE